MSLYQNYNHLKDTSIQLKPGSKLTECMTMNLVNLAKSSKSIFEFIFVPVIIGFFLNLKGGPIQGRANSRGAVKNHVTIL